MIGKRWVHGELIVYWQGNEFIPKNKLEYKNTPILIWYWLKIKYWRLDQCTATKGFCLWKRLITTEIKNVRVGGGKIKNPTWHKDLGHTDDDRSMVMRSCYEYLAQGSRSHRWWPIHGGESCCANLELPGKFSKISLSKFLRIVIDQIENSSWLQSKVIVVQKNCYLWSGWEPQKHWKGIPWIVKNIRIASQWGRAWMLR